MKCESQTEAILKNRWFEFIFLSVLWALFYFGVRFFSSKVGVELGEAFAGAVITSLFITYSYKKWWSVKTLRHFIGAFVLFITFALLFTATSYSLSLFTRSEKLYAYLTKEKKRGWKGKIHQQDPKLGFKAVANTIGYMTFNIGDDIPLAIDRNGFRIPLSESENNSEQQNVDLLFLGCSFTFGDACLAEETFPFLVAKATGTTYINAGACSYGLSQMMLLANELIPKYRPKYVIVQHSPWLIRRGIKTYAPTYFGTMPNPYFIKKQNSYDVHPPLYLSQQFNLDIEAIKKQSFTTFLFRKGLTYHLKEDWLKYTTDLKLLTGIYKRPVAEPIRVEGFAYNQICNLAQENGSKVIILTLYTQKGSTLLKKQLSRPEILFANADSLLAENLRHSKTGNFRNEYAHWRMNGPDSVIVDGHPNTVAHKIIATSIVPLINND